MKQFIARVKNNFITGVAVALPILLTFIILNWFVTKINLWFLEPFAKRIEPYFHSMFLLYLVKTGLLVLFLVIVVLIGAATKVLLLRKFFNVGEQVIYRVPIISKLYTSFKDVSSIFIGDRKRLFKRVILLEYPRKDLYTIGLVTAEHIDRKTIGKDLGDDVMSIFVPTTPNPTSGFFLLVPKKDAIETSLSLEEALKVIISGGAVANLRLNHDSEV